MCGKQDNYPHKTWEFTVWPSAINIKEYFTVKHVYAVTIVPGMCRVGVFGWVSVAQSLVFYVEFLCTFCFGY